MIWMRREKKRALLYGHWHRWFCWFPCGYVRTNDESKGSNVVADQLNMKGDLEFCTVWLSYIERIYHAGTWYYRLPQQDRDEMDLRVEALRLAPKYAKEIVLMNQTAGR